MPTTRKSIHSQLLPVERLEDLRRAVELMIEKIAGEHRLNRADVQKLEDRLTAVEAIEADHEGRITALEA